VADTGIFRLGHQVWQRANVMAAASYLREILTREPDNLRVRALHDGLLDVLDPTRRVLRQQRELARASSVGKQERRSGERRFGGDRRRSAMQVPAALERRAAVERRTVRDRRKP
jgi:hypothetical protein